MTGSVVTRALAAGLVALSCACALEAQDVSSSSVPMKGSIRGSILAAGTEAPLSGTAVVLAAPADTQCVTSANVPVRAPSMLSTDGRGSYRFDNLTEGSYRLCIRHIGYRPATILLNLPHASGLQLVVGLDLEPIYLEPIRVQGSLPGEAWPLSPAPAGRSARDSMPNQSVLIPATVRYHSPVM
jgi:Carboxypeptidase regulatory-like domain